MTQVNGVNVGTVELVRSEGPEVCCPLGHGNTQFYALKVTGSGKILTIWYKCGICSPFYMVPTSAIHAWMMYLERLKPFFPAPQAATHLGTFTPGALERY